MSQWELYAALISRPTDRLLHHTQTRTSRNSIKKTSSKTCDVPSERTSLSTSSTSKRPLSCRTKIRGKRSKRVSNVGKLRGTGSKSLRCVSLSPRLPPCKLTSTPPRQAGLLPWLDSQHRRYFIARDEHKVRPREESSASRRRLTFALEQKIVAICVLASIAHQSYSVKHAVTFVSVAIVISSSTGTNETFGRGSLRRLTEFRKRSWRT